MEQLAPVVYYLYVQQLTNQMFVYHTGGPPPPPPPLMSAAPPPPPAMGSPSSNINKSRRTVKLHWREVGCFEDSLSSVAMNFILETLLTFFYSQTI